jgi:catenin beta 1
MLQLTFYHLTNLCISVLASHSIYLFLGYDGVPVESMQGLDLNSHHSSTYGGGGGVGMDDGEDSDYEADRIPNPPTDNNQVAAWYDTDL